MAARSLDIAAGVRVRMRMRMSKQVLRIGVMRIAYAPVFGILRVDVGGADFSIETPFRNDCISAYCIHFFVYVA